MDTRYANVSIVKSAQDGVLVEQEDQYFNIFNEGLDLVQEFEVLGQSLLVSSGKMLVFTQYQNFLIITDLDSQVSVRYTFNCVIESVFYVFPYAVVRSFGQFFVFNAASGEVTGCDEVEDAKQGDGVVIIKKSDSCQLLSRAHQIEVQVDSIIWAAAVGQEILFASGFSLYRYDGRLQRIALLNPDGKKCACATHEGGRIAALAGSFLELVEGLSDSVVYELRTQNCLALDGGEWRARDGLMFFGFKTGNLAFRGAICAVWQGNICFIVDLEEERVFALDCESHINSVVIIKEAVFLSVEDNVHIFDPREQSCYIFVSGRHKSILVFNQILLIQRNE